jgi:phosphohistidine phosphatase SixA
MLNHPTATRSPTRARAMRLAPLALCAALGASLVAVIGPALAAPASVHRLVERLHSGGYVLVMRHAESPLARPSARDASPGNLRRERQLDAAGEASARSVGAALRRFDIPIGRIFSSPTFRALETIRFAGLGKPTVVPALAEGARGMSGPADRSRVGWLREAVRRAPPAGTNTLIVTHTPNILSAFGRGAAHIEAAEMLVFKPVPGRGARLVGRIRAGQW